MTLSTLADVREFMRYLPTDHSERQIWRHVAAQLEQSGCSALTWLTSHAVGLMLAMFQAPNKFFEADGRVTDISGADWDSIWGHVFED